MKTYSVVYSCPNCLHSGFSKVEFPRVDKAFCTVCDNWAKITFVSEESEEKAA